MEDEVINQSALVRGLGSKDTKTVKDVNTNNKYYWMLNKYGRKVPVNIKLEMEKLKLGYTHTDRAVQCDDLAERVSAPAPVNPMEAMAKAAEKMATAFESVGTDVLAEKKAKK